MSKINKIIRYAKKLAKVDKYYLNLTKYTEYYDELELDEKSILLESQHGGEISGNIYYILKYLTSDDKYKDFKIYLTAKPECVKKINGILKKSEINNVNIVVMKSKEYLIALASAKYLINDNTFLPFFIKKDGQVYLNTWHGTPLKTLGRKIKDDFHNIGNTQKNFIAADYLLYPNNHTRDNMINDYMIENLSKAKIAMCGYPRNTAFFDIKSREEIKSKFALTNKKVYAYMPTWRGQVGSIDDDSNAVLQGYLAELDSKLADDEILYVNLHPIAKKDIDFSGFKKITQFPAEYETYEFLNACDCLITDYSSVFFDYAITKNKIVLFTYDKEEYLAGRGMYLSLDDLPFPKVYDVDGLLGELRSPKGYDDTHFLDEFCKYDCENATEMLCDSVILGMDTELVTEQIKSNGKDNVLLYVGNLNKNGITSSMRNLLESIDTSKRNYFITFNANKVINNKDILNELPEGVSYISMLGRMNATIKEKLTIMKFSSKHMNAEQFMEAMEKAYRKEVKRLFADADFANVIQFNGYEFRKLFLFCMFDSNTIVYVHSDMQREIETRNNQRRDVLEYCYSHYDKLALVTEDLTECTSTFTGGKTEHFYIANNFINYKSILEKSNEEVKLDEYTEMNTQLDKLIDVLEGSCKKFVTIGRFSPEKGHERLIDSFCRLWESDNSIYLIIIGGLGYNYEVLCEKIPSLKCRDNIILIRDISNPYSILRKCDYFVLSSFYEGFGIVLAEADIVGVPVISVDIEGPRNFMKKYGGTLVENSEDGIYDGMKRMLNGEVKPMNIDFEEYNQNAVRQFENLLES